MARRVALLSLLAAVSCKESPAAPPPDTEYDIVIRFFGTPMTAQQQALFTNAAARISQIVTGDLIAALADSVDLEDVCDVTGVPALSETIDDIVIYSSIQSIDGAGNVVAQAGPCMIRNTATGAMTAIGVMQFDSADLPGLSAGGRLQDVVTHEMLHVLGVGTLWEDRSTVRNPCGPTQPCTTDPRYTGSFGRQGCVTVGGTVTCSTDVPVEDVGGEGSADAHWRESVFNTELMTSTLDATMPLSVMTVGALRDLGFQVNESAADSYTVPPTGPSQLRVGDDAGVVASHQVWERVRRPVAMLEPAGRTRFLRMP